MSLNRGISLIVLVITIIVIIILAGAVILSLVHNNPIGMSKEAKFKADMDAYSSQLNMAINQKYFEDHNFNPNTFDVPAWDGVSGVEGTIKEYIPSMKKEDAKKIMIQNSKFVYIGAMEEEIDWLTGIGIPNYTKLGLDVYADSNTTYDGNPATHNNPIIPKGFKAINDNTNWPADWNLGLVIEDESGNQFVWVPVDGINVSYKKWCTTGVSYELTSNDTILSGTVNETTQINNYGGFYIARYEAGNNSDKAISKKGVTVWTDINYYNSKLKAEEMYNTDQLKSGLITGIQWDTLLKWIQNSGHEVIDSRTWGNCSNPEFPANVPGYGHKQVTGYDENWKANNIYDLAGNFWEWTNEKYSTNNVYRSGIYFDGGNGRPAAYRGEGAPSYYDDTITFRVVLYVE